MVLAIVSALGAIGTPVFPAPSLVAEAAAATPPTAPLAEWHIELSATHLADIVSVTDDGGRDSRRTTVLLTRRANDALADASAPTEGSPTR